MQPAGGGHVGHATIGIASKRGNTDPSGMNTTPLRLLAAGLLAFASTAAYAAKDADLGQTLGKPAATDDLNRQELGKQWVVAKGEWQIAEGAIKGQELAKDKHAAVLTYARKNTDSAIQFSFKLDGTKGFHLSYNKSRGHLFRVIVSDRGVTISLDKDKKNPKSKPVKLASSPKKFEPGEWHTMRVTVEGERVSVQADNGLKLSAKHASLKQPKPNYRFVMRDASLLLDDLKIWEIK